MAMSQNLPIGGFMLAENTSQFSKDLKKYNEDSDKGYFQEVDVQ